MRVPPMTSLTVLTWIALEFFRPASQSANWLNVSVLTVRGSGTFEPIRMPVPTWWKVSWTQPPPLACAWVTRDCISASVQVLSS
ncbi:hypothetical protein D9M72_523290 [compost metagenome]